MKASLSVTDIRWAPPEWACNGFPLESAGQEILHMETVLSVLHILADTTSQADSTALGPAMHVAHMLIAWQGQDGEWPSTLNARTGKALGGRRTRAPLSLYRRLAGLLETSEFDHVIERSEPFNVPIDSHLVPEKES